MQSALHSRPKSPQHLREPSDWPRGVELLASGEAAFVALLRRIHAAERRIDMRAYIWRDDDTGRAVGSALLEAAERGVLVHVRKDLDAAAYEYSEGEGRSFFHHKVSPGDRLRAAMIGRIYNGRWRLKQQGRVPLAEALLGHPNVDVRASAPTYDHAKVFVFDRQSMLLGGMGIGNDARHSSLDFMIEIEGEAHVRRYLDREAGHAGFDPRRDVDFLLHNRQAHGTNSVLRDDRVALIRAAKRSLTIEMAYLGDRVVMDEIAAAVGRGVVTTLVAGFRASILRWLNHSELDRLLRVPGAAENLHLVLHPNHVHSKVVVIDEHTTDLGSANFTALSHGIYEEVNVCIRSRAFAEGVLAVLRRHQKEGVEVKERLPHVRAFAMLERYVMEKHVQRLRKTTRA